MTTIVAQSHRGSAGAIPRRLAFAAVGLGTGLRRRWRARSQAELLRHLDARTLQDIGIAPVARPQPSLFNAPSRAAGAVIETLENCARLR